MGNMLRAAREAKGMTQEELEKKSGISRQTISAIENGKTTNVKSGTLLALAKALDTTIGDIFFPDAV